MIPNLTPHSLRLFKIFYILLLSAVLLAGSTFFLSCESSNETPFLIGKGYGINNSSILVDDLDSTKNYFKNNLGFNINDNFDIGDFGGSLVATIDLADLSVLELLSVNDSLLDEKTPSFITSYLASKKGVRMYSLSTSSSDSTAKWLTSQGFQMDSIQSHRTSEEAPEGWSWDDGKPESYSLDFDSNNPPAHLPRFTEHTGFDYPRASKQWRTYYGYGRMYSVHPNGVVGTSAIRIAVDNLQTAKEEYKKMGFTALEINDSIVRYELIRNQEIQLIAPSPSDDALSEFLETNGSGVFALRFEVSSLDSTYQFLKNKLPDGALNFNSSATQLTLLREYAFGVQLEFVQESEEQGALAKMLRPSDQLDSTAVRHAAEMYTKYCALCHGDDREGYAADNAPSLRSHSLLATSRSNNFMRYTIQYGREGTAMAGYLDRQGGPLEYIDVEIILQWLYQTSEVEEPIELPRETVLGDIGLGATIYSNNCANCHGINGEGVTAPALGNPMLLATATDHFLRYAIENGRDGTPMIPFKEILSSKEIDDVTAFIRSRASGWNVPKPDTISIPSPDNYVLNPDRKAPQFTLREGKFISAEQVMKAMKDSLRMVILDARSEVAWRQMHIPGAFPVPYYEEPENFVNDLPNDSTQIVVYCACPHAASGRVVNTLRRHGFKNTAIIDEGVLVWAQLGYPVQHGN